jgi:hypothetical protein
MEGEKKMKYIVFWEFETDNVDKVIETSQAYSKASEKNPEKFQKYVYPPHYMGNGKGFSVVEITKPEQLVNTQVYWNNVLKLKHHPIVESTSWIEAYLK